MLSKQACVMKWRQTIAAAGLWAALGGAALAEPLAAPSAPVLLTVSGAIEHRNGPDGAAFDFEMLTALPVTVFNTATPWTEGEIRFEGVLLRDLLDRVGVGQDGLLRAYALNDYSVDIPVADVTPSAPIVAYLRDGQPMSVRMKGPLWIMYPFYEEDKYLNEVVQARAIWQLSRIEVIRE